MIRRYWPLSEKNVLFAKVANTLLRNLPEDYTYSLTPCNKFATRMPIISETFARGLLY
jgi:hypothetical protein